MLLIVEVRSAAGTHELYQVPVGIGPSAGREPRRNHLRARRRGALRRARATSCRRWGWSGWSSSSGIVTAGVEHGPLPAHAPRATVAREQHADGPRRAVQQLGRVRRHAHPEGLPAPRAGHQPGARDGQLPVRPRLPEHRRGAGLLRVRRRVARQHPRADAALPAAAPATAGSSRSRRCGRARGSGSPSSWGSSGWSRAGCTRRSPATRRIRSSPPRSPRTRTWPC